MGGKEVSRADGDREIPWVCSQKPGRCGDIAAVVAWRLPSEAGRWQTHPRRDSKVQSCGR